MNSCSSDILFWEDASFSRPFRKVKYQDKRKQYKTIFIQFKVGRDGEENDKSREWSSCWLGAHGDDEGKFKIWMKYKLENN